MHYQNSNLLFIYSLAIFFIQFFAFPLKSQDIVYARKLVDTLCSPAFSGRGYIHKGSMRAASFIAAEFERYGLEKFNNSYFQYFVVSVNTFPIVHVPELSDTIRWYVDPMSGSVDGSFRTVVFSDTTFFKKASLERLVRYLNKRRYKYKALFFSSELFENKEIARKLYQVIYSGELQSPVILIGRKKLKGWNTAMADDRVLPYAIIETDIPVSALPGRLDFSIKNQFFPDYTAANVIGFVCGSVRPDSFIVLCAHYDHLGMLGNLLFPGANDNASGVALLLDLARHFTQDESKLRYTLVFIAFGAEELGLRGSRYFVMNPLFDIKKIAMVLNLDMVGTGAEGIQVANGEVYPVLMHIIRDVNEAGGYFSTVKSQGERCNSDHCYFHQRKIPSIHIFTLDKNYLWYHVPEDNPRNLPLTGYESLFRLVRDLLYVVSYTK